MGEVPRGEIPVWGKPEAKPAEKGSSFKSVHLWGDWVVKHCLGLRSNPVLGSLLSGEPASPSTSACRCPCLCALSLTFPACALALKIK